MYWQIEILINNLNPTTAFTLTFILQSLISSCPSLMCIQYKMQPLCSSSHPTHCSKHALFYHFTQWGVFFVPLYHFALAHSGGVQMVKPEVDFMPASVRIMDRLLTRSNQTLPSPKRDDFRVCVCARPCARANNSKGERQKCWDKQIHGQFRFYLNIWAFPTKQPLGQTATHSDTEHSQNPSTPWK